MAQVNDNYKSAIKLFKSLKMPKEYENFIVKELLPHEDTYNICLSKRGKGKTTTLLAWALCLNACYGIIPQYIRQRKEHISPTYAGKLFDTINSMGWIPIITNGKYNYITRPNKSRAWHYANVDAEGVITDVCDNAVVSMLCVQNSLDYKSGYEAPHGDFILFDEFITTKGYLYDEFSLFQQLLSTIIRLRDTAHIYLCGNTIDPYCDYFNEFDIVDIIPTLAYNDHRHLKTVDDITGIATTLHIYSLPAPSEEHEKINLKYFGWRNRGNIAITAKGGMWSIRCYPKPPKGSNYTILGKRQIYHSKKYITAEYRQDENGVLSAVLYEDERNNGVILLTTDTEFNANFSPSIRYGYGYSRTDYLLFKLLELNRVYYANNSIGSLFNSYIKSIQQKGN